MVARRGARHGRRHARAQRARHGALGNALQGRPCRVFSSDLKIFIAETQLATYPDLSVVCGKLETTPEDANLVTNPTLIVEVLSDSTEAYDRGAKFAHYRRLPSLREYVLVSQTDRRIEVFRRTEDGRRWELEEAGPSQSITLSSVGCALSVDAVYFDPLAPTL